MSKRELSPKTIKYYGKGPWKVFMLVNTSSNLHNSPTELRIHTYPEIIEALLNDIAPKENNEWIIILTVGDFYCLEKAIEYQHCWLAKTRGFKSRLLQGLKLFHHLRMEEQLWANTVPISKKRFKYLNKTRALQEERFKKKTKALEMARRFLDGKEEASNIANIISLEDIYSNKTTFFEEVLTTKKEPK